uniref:Groucho/TLE N-terminal Q-rich domain-containing protein n=1 Tax=Catharus ustulatus TaxID=91951 RepID=A0A8C3UC80_CATUS
IQRHYVMYYEMSYGLNIEMHKQTEIAKRLNVICAQLIPFLSQEHQQQVVQAVERAKQVTMTDLNAAIGVRQPSALPATPGPGLPLLPMPFLPGHFPGVGARAGWGPQGCQLDWRGREGLKLQGVWVGSILH